jgi:peptidyl-prolyl cis-trans isomerase C
MTDHPMLATFRLCLLLGLVSASSVALSADPVVASVRGGASITADELMSEVLRLPAPAQAQALARAADLAQAAQNLAIRRELARQAEADSLPNDPAVAAALRSARERVLAEAALARLEGKAPDKAALERLARSQYDASPEKFETPEQVRVRHILVSAKACEAEARARDLLAQARQPGADFAALAKANSDDPGSAARGGDLGFSARGKMAPAFEAAAFALKQPGDLSDVVKTEFGYHVIRLEERKPASRQPFEAVREGMVKSLAEGEARNRRQEAVERIAAGVQVDQGVIEGLVASRGKPGS